MTWTVHIHDGAARQLETIPPDRRQRLLDDIAAFELDPFRGLVKPLKGKDHKGHYRKVSGRYRIIFKPIHSARTVEVLAVLLRNEKNIQMISSIQANRYLRERDYAGLFWEPVESRGWRRTS